MSHVQIDNDGSKNWLVIGINAPKANKHAKTALIAGCGAGAIAAAKDSKNIRIAYCPSYQLHLCFFSFAIFTAGLKDHSIAVTLDAGDWRECSLDRSFRL